MLFLTKLNAKDGRILSFHDIANVFYENDITFIVDVLFTPAAFFPFDQAIFSFEYFFVDKFWIFALE